MTLVTLISKDRASIIPVLFELKEKVKTHILIYDIDKQEIEIAKNLKKSLLALAKKYNLNYNIKLIPIDEDEKKFYKKSLEKIKRFKNLSLNTSQSDPTMTIIYSNFILNQNGVIYSYDKFDNTYNVISKNKCENRKIKNNMKIDDYMLLMGYEIKEFKKINSFYNQRKYLFKLLKKYKQFKNIKKLIKSKKYKINFNPYYDNILKKLNVIENNSINQNRISGELVEEYIFWHLLKLNFDDLMLNAKIITKREDKEIFIENEFDILGIKDNHIYIFEIKYGSLSNTPADIIYKLDALNDKFGEDTKSILIHISDNKAFSNRLDFRSKQNNILIHYDNNLNINSLLYKLKKKFSFKERAFLIGGCDLEMATIMKILKHCDFKIYNKNLKWGAKLSSYKEELKNDYHFYGIELIEDITPPKYYTKIDHHNELSNNPSSLEQICSLIRKDLSKFETLVAINDTSHIEGLKKFNVKENEINHIRYLDRKFQGVTKEDENQAIKDLKNIQYIENIPVIKTTLEKFSPITDRINKKEYIIYNDKEIVYYGDKVEQIKNKIDDKFYYGKGFLGILNPNYLDKLIKIIKAV